jgi:hypothetical protein
MPVIQRCFLHAPTRSATVIQDYINRRHSEGDQLDFKRPPPWKDGFEAAKDVAALANHLGGDIIIGVDDVDDCASAWNPIPDADVATYEGRILNWLTDIIRPREFANWVDIVPVKAPQAGHSAIVVSVPPYADLVGFEKGDRNFKFPIRSGKKTRWLVFEEIMSRASATTRGTYIRLKGLVDSFGMDAVPLIGFISPVLVVAGDELVPLPVEGGIHCSYDDLTPDVLSVRMRPSTGFAIGRVGLYNEGYHEVPTQSVSVPADQKLTIPLEFIRAAWKDRKLLSQSEHISIALQVTPVWRGLYWELVTSVFS